MASWTSPRGSVYRDSSPNTPLTPLSPSTLPQWLRAKNPPSTILPSARRKTVFVILGCIALGWLATSTLTSSGDDTLDIEAYDTASSGVLTDPSGYGTTAGQHSDDGILGDGEDDHEKAEQEDDGKPSVGGALTDLHHAVSDKIQSWSPYHHKQGAASKGNKTTSAKSQKAPNSTAGDNDGEEVKDGIKAEDRLGARTRIGKCTILFNGNSFWERSIQTHEQHDKIHGYRLHVLRQKLLDDVWDKPAYILSLLLRELAKPNAERLEWLFWVDADTIILNPYIPIETFLPPPDFDDIHLMYSIDWNGLNNGVFPIRVNQWAVDLFSAIVSYRYYRPEDPLVFRDQSAMNTLMLEPRFAKNIVNAPQRWFNAYQGEHNETLQPFQIRRGDLLVHFAGVPAREERMGYWLDRAEQHLDDWEIPVKSTSYPVEARDFWAQEREKRKDRKAKIETSRQMASQLLETTNQQLNEFGDRLTAGQMAVITESRDALQKMIADPQQEDDVETLDKLSETLREAKEPLAAAVGSSNKLLLSAAHDAIFAGEKDLRDGSTGASGAAATDLDQLSQRLQELKMLVMTPEESWNKAEIAAATDALTGARARLQANVAAIQKAKQEVQAKSNAISEAKKMVQIEAGLANPDGMQKTENAGIVQPENAGTGEHDWSPSNAVVGRPVAPPPGAANAATAYGADHANGIVDGEEASPAGTVVAHVVTITPEAVMIWTTATVAGNSFEEPTTLPDMRASG
ncbi:glycosyltransferase family 34 protein [Hortaea werneckii]|nr:glycosyltransferase family 34 protein [Hortaea werneckii]